MRLRAARGTIWLLIAGAAFSAACASFRDAPRIRPGRYHKIGVLPFSGEGDAAAFSDALAKALAERGFEMVPSANISKTFSDLKLGKQDSIGVEAREAVRQRTGAEAVVFGSVACRRGGAKAVQFLMLDTFVGEVLLQGRTGLASCERPDAASRAAKSILDEMGRAWAKSREEGNLLGDELGGIE